MARIIEGLWDCSYCGTIGIGGLTHDCPNCGKTRGQDTVFYMAGQKRYLSDTEVKNVGTEPDWHCSNCDSLNSSFSSCCKNCGNLREQSTEDYFDLRYRKGCEKEKSESLNYSKNTEYFSNHCSNNPPALSCHFSPFLSSDSELKEVDRKNKNDYSPSCHYPSFLSRSMGSVKENSGIIFGILAVILIISLLGSLFTPKIVTGTVEDFRWERSISIEEYRTVDENGWYLPSDARLKYMTEQIKYYEDVLDHYETRTRTYTEEVFDHYDYYYTYTDNGNGTFTEHEHSTPVYRTETRTEYYDEPIYRSEPVYGTMYYYEVDRWVWKENVESCGNDKEPYWGEYEFSENEREGGRTEQYFIRVAFDDDTKEYSVEYETWNSLKYNDNVELKVYIGGNAELCEEELRHN